MTAVRLVGIVRRVAVTSRGISTNRVAAGSGNGNHFGGQGRGFAKPDSEGPMALMPDWMMFVLWSAWLVALTAYGIGRRHNWWR